MGDLNTSTSSGVAATQSVVLRPAALVSPGNSLEMQNLRPIPDPLNRDMHAMVNLMCQFGWARAPGYLVKRYSGCFS